MAVFKDQVNKSCKLENCNLLCKVVKVKPRMISFFETKFCTKWLYVCVYIHMSGTHIWCSHRWTQCTTMMSLIIVRTLQAQELCRVWL